MLLLFIIINKLYEKGEIKYSVISILISIFIVNIHFPMWILVPVFFLPYIVQIIIKYIKDKYNIKLLDNKFIIEDCKSKKKAHSSRPSSDCCCRPRQWRFSRPHDLRLLRQVPCKC